MTADLKKNLYLSHYWSLFLDFIDLFKNLTYLDIPLPLLANFYQFLDSDVKEIMGKPGFANLLDTPVLNDKEIQPRFEHYLNPIKTPIQPRPIQGKLLLNLDYLRFSQHNYAQYFSPKHSIIFARFRKNDYLGIPVHCIKDYMMDVSGSVNILTETAHHIFSSVKGHPVFDTPFFKQTMMTRLPMMIETIAAINNYLETEGVSCVIVGTTEDLASRVLSIIAGKKGIPSICMQHGLLGGPEAFIPVFSNTIAVYGYYEKDWYLNKGVAEDQIWITGHPRYDDIFTQSQMSKEKLLQKYNLDSSKKTLLLATQPNYSSLWNEFIEILAQDPKIQIILKPHPWETLKRTESARKSMDSYAYFSNRYKNIQLFDSRQGVSLFDILANIDLVVCNYSTVGLETMLFDKPLFILSPEKISYYHKLDKFTLSNPIELVLLISNFFRNEYLQRYAENVRKEFLAYAYPQKVGGEILLEKINKLLN